MRYFRWPNQSISHILTAFTYKYAERFAKNKKIIYICHTIMIFHPWNNSFFSATCYEPVNYLLFNSIILII